MLTNLMHQFCIVDEIFIMKYTGRLVFLADLPMENNINIHDDVILFIWNSLKILKCRNYKNEKEKYGLYYDGSSYIHFEQLELFYKIISIWLSFIDLIDKKFIIINERNDECEKAIIKDDLEKLSKLIKKAIDEKKSILHFGI